MTSDICDRTMWTILRVWNSDVRENVRGVMDSIVAALHTPTPDPSPQRGGEQVRHRGGVSQ